MVFSIVTVKDAKAYHLEAPMTVETISCTISASVQLVQVFGIKTMIMMSEMPDMWLINDKTILASKKPLAAYDYALWAISPNVRQLTWKAA